MAGDAVVDAAVPPPPRLGPGGKPRAPGFFAEDIGTLLRERDELLQSFGRGGCYASDDLHRDSMSNSSESWHGEDENDDEDKKPESPGPTAGMLDLLAVATSVDTSELQYANARAKFAHAAFKNDKDGELAGEGADEAQWTHQVPVRHLRRLRAEVEALCTWAEAHKEHAGAHQGGHAAVTRETDWLSNEAQEVGRLLQQASSSGASGSHDISEAGPKQVWLGRPERADLTTAQQLLELSSVSRVGQDHAAHPGISEHGSSGSGGHAYRLTAHANKDGSSGLKGGWLAAAEGEALSQLEARLQSVRQALGQGGSLRDGQSLAGAATELHSRLDALQRISDQSGCQQLQTSTYLLATDISLAVAEASRLEALEADLKEDSLGADDLMPEETSPADQIAQLHTEVAGLDAVASRVAELDVALAKQARLFGELDRFSCDLASSEAQAQHAKEMLRTVQEVAATMLAATKANREQVEKNTAALSARLDRIAEAERQAAKEQELEEQGMQGCGDEVEADA